MRVGVADQLRRRVAEDPLQREDVPADHDKVTGENVSQIMDANSLQAGALQSPME